MDHGLSITLQRPGRGRILLIVEGSVNMGSAPELKGALVNSIQTRGEKVIVDVAGVDSLGSLGLGVLLHAARRATGRSLVIVCGVEAMRVLRLLGVERVVSLHASREEALAA